MSMNFARPVLLLLGVFLLGGCATFATKPALAPAETHLVGLMAQRLEIGRQVAWIKYQNHSPVRDKKREQELLASLTAQGAKLGLSARVATEFFRAQIAASCQLQQQLIYLWKRGAPLPVVAPRDLQREIRPELDRISVAMLRDLAAMRGSNPALRAYAGTELKQAGFSRKVTRTAVSPL